MKLADEALFIPELGIQRVINPRYKNTKQTEQKGQPVGQICPKHQPSDVRWFSLAK